MVNGTLLNFGKRYEDDLRVILISVGAKVALRYRCAKPSKNLKRHLLLNTYHLTVSKQNMGN